MPNTGGLGLAWRLTIFFPSKKGEGMCPRNPTHAARIAYVATKKPHLQEYPTPASMPACNLQGSWKKLPPQLRKAHVGVAH